NTAQVRSDLIGQHFPEAQAEQMRGIATVRSRADISPHPRRASWTTMAKRATIREAGSNGVVRIQVTHSITFIWTLSLCASELPLKQLPATADGAKRIAVDDENRGTGSHDVAPTDTDFLQQRLGDSGFGRVGRLRAVGELCPSCN